jgi:hypothetical protein
MIGSRPRRAWLLRCCLQSCPAPWRRTPANGQIAGLVVAGLVAWVVIAYFMGNPKFWRLVGRHSDLALTLFTIERGCIVDKVPPPSQKANYTGPFRIFATDGTTHTVYILHDDLPGLMADLVRRRVAVIASSRRIIGFPRPISCASSSKWAG